jgi:drug/metabolite transporter (DMT)-like permease
VYPTIVVIISSILFKKPIRSNQVFALLLTYGGIALVVFHDLAFYQNDAIKGSVLIFLSAVTYAMYLIGTEKLIPLLGTIRFTAYAMIVSTVAVVIHYLLLEDVKIFDLNTEVYWLALFMAVVATVIPSFFISEGIRMIGSGSASIVGSIGPVSTIVLAYVFLGEKITGFQMIGTALVLAGVLIVSSKNGMIEKAFGKAKNLLKKSS